VTVRSTFTPKTTKRHKPVVRLRRLLSLAPASKNIFVANNRRNIKPVLVYAREIMPHKLFKANSGIAVLLPATVYTQQHSLWSKK
jgi:hypothetical protein